MRKDDARDEFPSWHPAALGETEDAPGTSLPGASSARTGTPYTGKASTQQSFGTTSEEGEPRERSRAQRSTGRSSSRGRRRSDDYKKGFRKPKPHPKSPFAPAMGAAPAEEPAATKKSSAKNRVMFREDSRLAQTEPADELEAMLVQGLGSRPENERSGRGRRAPREPESEFTKAKNIVLNQLAASAKSRQQLEKKLAEKEISSETAQEVLDRFEAVNLVNDEEFAQMYVRTRASVKKLSKNAIRRELKEKGVTGELAETALTQRTEEDERSDAHELVRKKIRPSMDFSDRKEKDKITRRLVGMLARKGYPPSMAFSVVKEEIEHYIETNGIDSAESADDPWGGF